MLDSGKVLAVIATHLAGGSLIAINKSKDFDCDVRPIAIGKVLCHLTDQQMLMCHG